MATLNPYLNFDGNCREAMEFYRTCLGGELSVMTYGDAPDGTKLPAAERAKLMHAHLKTAQFSLMAADQPAGSPLQRGNDVSLMLYCESEAEIRRLFPLVSAGGKIDMPLAEQFWDAVFGSFTDRFGVNWMMNWDKPA
jgi:PhnB protein